MISNNSSTSSSSNSSPAALPGPPAPPTSSSSSRSGALVATVLSSYDLPTPEPPLAVSVTIAGITVRTGPPAARHKDKNSFRFVTNQVLRVESSLRTLYNSQALFTVEYENPQNNLYANVLLKTLRIRETAWLILNLESKPGTIPATTTSTTLLEEDDSPPTLRLQLRLDGPYRMEIAALVQVGTHWFHAVDHVEDSANQLVAHIPDNLPSPKYLLVPAVPIATGIVVLSPILLGIMVVGLPVFLPVLVIAGSALLGLVGVGVVLYASTRSGRNQVGGWLAPVVNTLLSTPSGQTLVYETGPRPTPVSVARLVLPKELWSKLMVSLLIDLMGSSSYLLPFVGEGLDLAWAPIQTIFIMAMYDHVSPNLKYISFVEEILPFTDLVPSATMGWLAEFGPQIISMDKTAIGGPSSSSFNGTRASMELAPTRS